MRISHLDEHAEGEVELVSPQLEDVRLKGLLVLALGSLLLKLRILSHNPVFPSIHPVSKLEVVIRIRPLFWLLLNCLDCCLLFPRSYSLFMLESFDIG